MPRPRSAIVLRGTESETLARARALVAGHDVLWVSPRIEEAIRVIAPSRVRALLGFERDAVVLDLHHGFDPDVLGQCEGMVRGGGALILRLPIDPPRAMCAALAVAPFSERDVGMRLWDRFERLLEAQPFVEAFAPSRDTRGTAEQAAAIAQIAAVLGSPVPAMIAVISDRGRGKSSALGLALAALPPLRAAIVADHPSAVAEVRRFAPAAIRFVPAIELARAPRPLDVIAIDEAARIPVPILQRIVAAHPSARIAFASTARGYEGTGRGFVLRFLEWARGEGRGLTAIELREPIRWSAGDPLERFVHRVLALDAEPAPDRVDRERSRLKDAVLDRERSRLKDVVLDRERSRLGDAVLDRERSRLEDAVLGRDWSRLQHAVLDRDRLARDETLLRDVFGLLVHAHYRTSPRDLHRMLDAPNLAVHALLEEERAVAASIVAREGGLDPATCAALARGEARIRGHALADTLITHGMRPEAGELTMIRSVRIAVHPARRRLGLARRLVREIHASYAPDLFATMFGATPELVSFRRRVGYELVRLGASRGARSGEPAAIMIAPISERARALVRDLRIELARSLAIQLELLEAEGPIDPGLAPLLARDLPIVAPLDPVEQRAILERYLRSPQTFDAAAAAITEFVQAHRDALVTLDRRDRVLIELRVLGRRSWAEVAGAASLSVPAAMRALRPALAALLRAAAASR